MADDRVIRPEPRWQWWVVLATWVLQIAFRAALLVVGDEDGFDRTFNLVFLVFLVVTLPMFVRQLSFRISVLGDSLEIVQWIGSTRVPFADVAAVTTTWSTMCITRRDGSEVLARGFGHGWRLTSKLGRRATERAGYVRRLVGLDSAGGEVLLSRM